MLFFTAPSPGFSAPEPPTPGGAGTRVPLHIKILIALVLGIAVGLLVNAFRPSLLSAAESSPTLDRVFTFLTGLTGFIGALFIRALRFIAVPIVLFSLVVGAASVANPRRLGRIGLKTIGIYLATTALAITIGLILANIINPGAFVSEAARDEEIARHAGDLAATAARTDEVPGVWDQLLNIVPANPFAAIAQAEMLQVIVAALTLGIGLTLIPRDRAAPVVALCAAITDAIVALVHLLMRAAPLAVFCLVIPPIATMGLDVLKAMAAYSATLLLGLAIMALAVYPLLLTLFARYPVRRFLVGIAPAQLLAFSSSSSSATLPITMDCVRERMGVSEEITSFVCPLGATINMDGTAMYQGVATVFIAQMFGLDLSLTDQLIVVLTATLASIGTPGIPGAGVVMLIIVLESVDVPAEGIAVILGVDRILDMCRTVVNVTGDAMTSVLVAKSEGETFDVPIPDEPR